MVPLIAKLTLLWVAKVAKSSVTSFAEDSLDFFEVNLGPLRAWSFLFRSLLLACTNRGVWHFSFPVAFISFAIEGVDACQIRVGRGRSRSFGINRCVLLVLLQVDCFSVCNRQVNDLVFNYSRTHARVVARGNFLASLMFRHVFVILEMKASNNCTHIIGLNPIVDKFNFLFPTRWYHLISGWTDLTETSLLINRWFRLL